MIKKYDAPFPPLPPGSTPEERDEYYDQIVNHHLKVEQHHQKKEWPLGTIIFLVGIILVCFWLLSGCMSTNIEVPQEQKPLSVENQEVLACVYADLFGRNKPSWCKEYEQDSK